MKVQKKKIGGKVELAVVASVQEVNDALDGAQLAFAQDMKLNLSPDKSISQLAAEQMGIRDLDCVVQHQAADRLVPFALDKTDTIPLDRCVPTSSTPLERNKEFCFRIEVEPKPIYELSSYEPVTVSVSPFKHDKTAVDAEIAKICERNVKFPLADPRPIEDGDDVKIALMARVNGKKIEQLSTDGRIYSLGRGFMPREFDEGLIGMEMGQTRVIEFDGPFTDNDGQRLACHYVCKVTALEQRGRVIDELSDAWVSEHVQGYSTVADLREAIARQVSAKEHIMYRNYVRDAVVAKFAEQFNAEVPSCVVENTFHSVMADLKHRIADKGIDFQEYVDEQGGAQTLHDAVMSRARQSVSQDFSLDALFAHEGLVLEEQDINAAAADIDPIDPCGARKSMESTGRGFALREIAGRYCASRWLLENSTISVVVCAEQNE